MFNEICPHCKKFYMEPSIIVSTPKGYYEGLFVCPGCFKKTAIYEIKEECRFAYPFEDETP